MFFLSFENTEKQLIVVRYFNHTITTAVIYSFWITESVRREKERKMPPNHENGNRKKIQENVRVVWKEKSNNNNNSKYCEEIEKNFNEIKMKTQNER